METTTQTAPKYTPEPPAEYRIYVACLAAYNNGTLHGEWIDCDGKTAEELDHEVKIILWKSPNPNVPAVYCNNCGHVKHYPTGNTCEECDSEETEQGDSAEEFAIHDHDGFGSLIGEYTPLDEIADIVTALEAAEEPAALIALAENNGETVREAAMSFEDAYNGEWDSELAYATDHMESCHTIPDELANYIDYEAFRRDLFCGDYWSEDTGKGTVFIFRSF